MVDGEEYMVVHMDMYMECGSGWNGGVDRIVPCMLEIGWAFGIHWLDSNCANVLSWKVPYSSKNVSSLVFPHP